MIEDREKSENINRENDRKIESEESKFSNKESQDNKDKMTIEEIYSYFSVTDTKKKKYKSYV